MPRPKRYGPVRRGPYSEEGKSCIDCLIPLNKNNVAASNIKQATYLCTACSKIRSQKRYIKHKEKIKAQQKSYERANKIKVVEAYGGKCNCCGETAIEFLTIDHINNNGVTERKETKQGTGGKMYRWLIKNGFPKDNYQLLCFNCNMAKSFLGYCPHKNK